SLRWAIGNALEVVADDDVFEDLVELARDRRYGRAREMIVVALGNMGDPRAVDVLINLLEDEEVAGHAVVALGKQRAGRARPYVERFLDHPTQWVREAARSALERIDAA
ncbi:MAG: HEAT repeat domain-containing protein, partial [Thermocrispum sp.]